MSEEKTPRRFDIEEVTHSEIVEASWSDQTNVESAIVAKRRKNSCVVAVNHHKNKISIFRDDMNAVVQVSTKLISV